MKSVVEVELTSFFKPDFFRIKFFQVFRFQISPYIILDKFCLCVSTMKYSLSAAALLSTKSKSDTFLRGSTVTLTDRTIQQAALDFCNGVETPYGPLEDWDVSNVTNMKSLFDGENHDEVFKTCNLAGVENWDVSAVTTMEHLFDSNSLFNADLTSWDTGNVERFDWMFTSNPLFEGKGIDKWDTKSAKNMSYMVALCPSFDRNINSWDVSKVTKFDHTFYGASGFMQSIADWDVESAKTFSFFLCKADLFENNLCEDSANHSWQTLYCEDGKVPTDPCPWSLEDALERS